MSIIVPIYNTPINDLKRCFESLANQTCKDFALIVVNNNSDEYVASYLDKIINEKVFDSIEVLNEYRKGVSYARNLGLENVKTSYFSFSDSDDTYDKDFVKKIYKYLEDYNYPELIIGNVEYYPKWESQIKIDKNRLYSDLNDIVKLKESFFEFRNRNFKYNINVGPYAKVYRTDSFKNIRFCEDVDFGEDQLYVLDILNHTNNALVVNDVFYNYYQNEYSASREALKNVSYEKYKTLWDHYYIKLSKETEISENKLSEFKLRLLNGFINRTCASNKKMTISKSIEYLKKALSHKLMVDMLSDIRAFTDDISVINSINVLLLKFKLYGVYILEKKSIYTLGLQKDKI